MAKFLLHRLPSGARRLRCTAGTSDKFYDIILEGNTYTVHYGRWGSSGAFQTKEFKSPYEAREAYTKMIESKLRKGYVDVTGTEGVSFEQTRLAMIQSRNRVNDQLASKLEESMLRKTPENQGRRRRKLID